jgi:hypothetical protein
LGASGTERDKRILLERKGANKITGRTRSIQDAQTMRDRRVLDREQERGGMKAEPAWWRHGHGRRQERGQRGTRRRERRPRELVQRALVDLAVLRDRGVREPEVLARYDVVQLAASGGRADRTKVDVRRRKKPQSSVPTRSATASVTGECTHRRAHAVELNTEAFICSSLGARGMPDILPRLHSGVSAVAGAPHEHPLAGNMTNVLRRRTELPNAAVDKYTPHTSMTTTGWMAAAGHPRVVRW